MLALSHRKVTEKAFRILYNIGHRKLHQLKQTVAEEAGKVDDYRNLELIDVESAFKTSGGRDDPHVKKAADDDDIARYEYEGYVYTALNHFIDIKKGPGLFDDYDGYSYQKGSASNGEYQDASDAKKDYKVDLITGLTGHKKVDDALIYLFNDEYVHAPGHDWYSGCSPSVTLYSFPDDKGAYSSIEAEANERFPLADPIGKEGKGIPYSVFMPVDNMARYWYNIFINTYYPKALGPVMHAIQDASIPHHAAGYIGNWHQRYENDLETNLNKWLSEPGFVRSVKKLYKQWVNAKGYLPNQLDRADYRKSPTLDSRSDTLVTWVALNAYREYDKTYDHFKDGHQFNHNSMRKLTEIATAMSMFVLYKALRDMFKKSLVSFTNRDEAWGIKVHLKPRQFPTQLVRHQNFLGKVSEINTPLDQEDATFKIMPGLADFNNGVSFESVNYPGYYLRHENYRIKLAQFNKSKLFKADATFRMLPGWSANHFAFMSYNYPTYFIRQKNSHLRLDNIALAATKKDYSFWVDASFLVLLSPDALIL